MKLYLKNVEGAYPDIFAWILQKNHSIEAITEDVYRNEKVATSYEE